MGGTIRMLGRYLAILVFLSSFCCASAAELKTIGNTKDTSSVGASIVTISTRLLLSGDIEKGDLERIKSLKVTIERRNQEEKHCGGSKCETTLTNFDLYLNSDGGLFSEGLRIAEFVADSQIRTLIGSGSKCFSACAYIFLAGQFDHSGEGVQDIADPHRFVFESSQLGLHAPFLEIDEQNNSKEVVEAAYSLAVRDISEIVRLSRKINLDTVLVPIVLKPGKKEMYLIDRVERAVRFNVPVVVKGFEVKRITPAMARNYCQYLLASKANKFVSDVFASSNSNVINQVSSYLSPTSDRIVFQSKAFKTKTADGPADRQVYLVPLRRGQIEEFHSVEVCAFDWYVWPRSDRINVNACVLNIDVSSQSAANRTIARTFALAWPAYEKSQKTDNSTCESGNLAAQEGNLTDSDKAGAALFVPADTPLEKVSSVLKALSEAAVQSGVR